MATQAKIGHGTKLYIGDSNSPGVWTPVAEITSIKPPSVTRDVIDATNSDSPDKWREHIPGLKDGGEVSFEGNFIPSGASTGQLILASANDAAIAFKIEWPDSPPTVWEFQGFVTAFEPDASFDDKMTFSSTIKVSGKPQFVTDLES
jgi:predicted secreted protein